MLTESAPAPVIFLRVLETEGRGRQTWYDFFPLSSMIRGLGEYRIIASHL